MARAAFLNIPAHGHVNPTLPVVAELMRLGESVIYFNTEEFRSKIEQTGAEFRGYGPSFAFRPDELLLRPTRLAPLLLETGLRILPKLLAQLRSERIDYVIHDSVCPWGRYAAEVLGLPAISSTTTFAVRPELFPRPGALGLPRAIARDFSAHIRLRAAGFKLRSLYPATTGHGLYDVFSNRSGLNVVYTAREFQPRPELFDDSYRFVGPSLDEAAPTEPLLAQVGDAPLIYVSLGSLLAGRPEFYRVCIEALGGLPEKVLLTAEDLGPVPANFVVARRVEQLAVLARASLAITHGGMNSVSEALSYGVPMLVLPHTSEQRLVAARVREVGAGLVLSQHPDREELRKGVRTVLDDASFRRAAARMGESLKAAGGYRRAAAEILNYRVRCCR
jgi:MGT family glycosyltransferase